MEFKDLTNNNKWQFNEEERQIWDNSSKYLPTTSVEDITGMGNYEALFTSMNGIKADYEKRKFLEKEVDISSYTQEFNREEVIDAFTTQHQTSPYVLGQILSASDIKTWEQAEKARQYYTYREAVERQVADNFSMGTTLALGIPMTFADYDIALAAFGFGAFSKANKLLNLSSRMSKVAAYSIEGAALAVGSEALYEKASGVYRDDSFIEAATLGLFFGGSLAYFTTRAKNLSHKVLDPDGNVVNYDSYKATTLKKLQNDLTKLDETITTSTTKAVDEGDLEFTTRASEDVTVQQSRVDTIRQEFNEVETELTKLQTMKQTRQGEIDNIKTSIDNTKAEIETIKKQLADLPKQTATKVDRSKKGKVVKSNKQQTTKAREQLTKKLNNDLAKLNKKLVTDSKKLEDKTTKVNKAISRIDKDIEKVETQRQEVSTRLSKSEETLNVANLSNKRLELEDRIKRISEDDYTALGVRDYRTNPINTLNNELEEANNNVVSVSTLGERGRLFQQAPDFLKKIVISPVEVNFKSKDEKVVGLTSMLHSGTLHHGKVDTRTAWAITQQHNGELSLDLSKINYIYKDAVKDGLFKGSKEEFETEVSKYLRKLVGSIQRRRLEGLPAGLTKEEKYELAAATPVQRQHTSLNEAFVKASDKVLDYYERIFQKGNRLEMEAFRKSFGTGFLPRFYDRDKILALNSDKGTARQIAIDKLYDAQVKYARENGFDSSSDEILKSFREKATTAIDASLNRQDKLKTITKGLDSGGSTSHFKERTIEAFDDDLDDLLDDDAFMNMQGYGLATHGRLALKEKIGVDNRVQMDMLLSQLDATPNELNNFNAIIDTILNTREVVKNPFTVTNQLAKGISSAASLSYMGAFGINTISEITMLAKEVGFRDLMRTFMPSVRQVRDLYWNGTPTDKNNIELMQDFGGSYYNYRANRYEMESPLEAGTRFQEWMDYGVHKLSIFSGLLPITDFLKIWTSSSSTSFLARMSVKQNISKGDYKRLMDMGFDAEDLVQIRNVLKVSEDGRINNMDRTTWGEFDTRITDASRNMVERTILHPNGITLPKAMSNVEDGGWFARVFMKFMRFPIESYERLFLRGMQIFDAKQAIAFAGNVGVWAAILMAKDAMREEGKQKYSDDDEGFNNLFKDALLQQAYTAGLVAIPDRIAGFVTGENLTNNYPANLGGVVGSMFEQIHRGDLSVSYPLGRFNVGNAFGEIMQGLGLLEETTADIEVNRKEWDVIIPRQADIDYNNVVDVDRKGEGFMAREYDSIIDELYEEFSVTEGNGDTTGVAATGARGLTTATYNAMKKKYGDDITEEEASKLYLEEAYTYFNKKWYSFDYLPINTKKALLDSAYNLGYTQMPNFSGLTKSILNQESGSNIMVNLLDTANLEGKTSKGLAKRRATAYNIAVPNSKVTSVEQLEDGTINYYKGEEVFFTYGKGRGKHKSSKAGIEVL